MARLYSLLVLVALLFWGASPVLAQDATVTAAQEALRDLGYDPGPIDGLMGQSTRTALTRFQDDRSLPASGNLDSATLDALGVAEVSAPPGPGDSEVEVRALPPLAQSDAPPVPGSADDTAASPAPTGDSDATPGSAGGLEQTPSWFIWAGIGGIALWFLVRWRRSKQSIRVEPIIARKEPRAFAATPDPQRQEKMPVAALATGEQCWVAPGQNVRVEGQSIGGMIYVGRRLPQQGARRPENCLIEPSLPIARDEPDLDGELMPYWPSYSDIHPRCRQAYLRWLASGRSETACIGYVLLYFYGLERRVLVARCAVEERAQIGAEVLRLRELFANDRSFRGYAEELLDAIAILDGLPSPAEPSFEGARDAIPIDLQIAIGRKVQAGEALSADWLLAWWWHHPQTNRRTALRVFPDFHRLFAHRFAAAYPQDFIVAPPQERLHYSYQSASRTFEIDLTALLDALPAIAGLTAPVKAAEELAEACLQELGAFSRDLDGSDGVEATPLAALDPQHRDLVEDLLQRERWSATEFKALATELGLVPRAALETINAWAFSNWREPLLDDDEDSFFVSTLIADELMSGRTA